MIDGCIAASGRTVVVVGGGCSGVLVAAHLLGSADYPVDVVLVDPGDRLGSGVAYGTTVAEHLLNVPAGEMSAFASEPNDFLMWAQQIDRHIARSDFLPRALYRRYLADVIAGRRPQPRNPLSAVEHVRAEVVALRPTNRDGQDKLVVGLREGGHIEADNVVLALGVPSPSLPWVGVRGGLSSDPRIIVDPWQPGALDQIPKSATVLLIGTGLTMVDVALQLSRESERKLVARSRHGLLPLAHSKAPLVAMHDAPTLTNVHPASARPLMRAIRELCNKATAENGDWRAVIAALRTEINSVWVDLSCEDQARLERHAFRYWEIHRHRMPPASAESIERLKTSGQLDIGRASVASLDPSKQRISVSYASPSTCSPAEVDVVVNCTGPSMSNLKRSTLVGNLLKSGVAVLRPDGRGIALDEAGDLADSDGSARARIHTIGWMRRSMLVETTAVPELRCQAANLVEHIGRSSERSTP